MVIVREPKSGEGPWPPSKASPLERHTSSCTAAAAAGSNIHGQVLLLPCTGKLPAWLDKGLAHRPRLAGNFDGERRQRLETRSAAMGHRASRSADWRRDEQCRSTLPNLGSNATRRNQLVSLAQVINDGQWLVLVGSGTSSVHGAP